MDILHPMDRVNEQDAVYRWITSEEFMKAEQECQRTWEDYQNGKMISSRKFTHFSLHTKLLVNALNKNRTGAYELTNKEIRMR